jgi:single-stranded-DNA-specific exonuclease
MSQTFSLHPKVVQVLKTRGLNDQDIQQLFRWSLEELPDVTQMLDLEKGALRLIKAIKSKERIAIYGDYDVDGTTSCALLYHFFLGLHVAVDLFQPGRFQEGYGIHLQSIDNALAKNVRVLVTVDCGISNNETATYALNKLDLIITDHHKDGRETLPEAYAVINPNRRDEPLDSPLKALAGVGVAFALALKIRQLLLSEQQEVPSVYPLLQFVAVGTLCDLALLTPLNRQLVKHGLLSMKQQPFPGLKAFLTEDDFVKEIIPSDRISFHIGPKINSKGRLEHPEAALQVLLAGDLTTGQRLLSPLENSNQERKSIQQKVVKEAQDLIKQKYPDGVYPPGLVLYQPHWHEGVIGIVASKMVEEYKRPTLILTQAHDEGLLKGSGRTAGKLDLYSVLKKMEHHFTKFGGHQAAAGFSLEKKQLSSLEKSFHLLLEEFPLSERTTLEHFDSDCDFYDVDLTLVRHVEKLTPFGRGHERPLFRLKPIKLHSFTLLKNLHLKWTFAPLLQQRPSQPQFLQGISFFYTQKQHAFSNVRLQQMVEEQIPLQAIVSVDLNVWNKKESVQLLVKTLTLN